MGRFMQDRESPGEARGGLEENICSGTTGES